MPTNMNEVLAYLEPDEPNYAQAAKLGPDALPYLKEIIDKQDVMLASKAAYLVSLIKSEESLPILEYAALNKNPTIRVAVASGIRNISEKDANMLLDKFIEDKDVGVRKVTLKSVAKFKSSSIVSKVQKLLESDPEPSIRKLASDVIETMK
jgi:HEAT repeat protein